MIDIKKSRKKNRLKQLAGGLLLIVLIVSGIYSGQKNAASPDLVRPNIIIIMTDDMGFSDIGCYGGEIPTPNIDRLANKGLRFSQFYNTARCCPTRASLLTGLFPHQTGIGHMTEEPANPNSFNYGTEGYQGYLNRNCVTIAEVLKPAGYHTYMTGKWHLGFHNEDRWPLQRGFEKYYGILAGAASYFKPQGGRGLFYNNTKLPAPENNYYTTDAFTDSAIAFVNQQKDEKPFFLYLAYNAPHWPLHAKAEDINKFESYYEKGWDVIRQDRYNKQLKSGVIDPKLPLSARDTSVRAWNKLDKEEQKKVAHRMAVYAAQISSIDQNIGKLVHSLQQRGKLENTLILFLSDNGACPEPYSELGGGTMQDINDPQKSGAISYGMGWANASNTPYRKWKTELEEGGISTPLIVHWPAGISKNVVNKVHHVPSYLIDIFPTLLEVSNTSYPSDAGVNQLHPLEGRSILGALKGKTVSPHTYMYWEHQDNQAIRKGNWKAVKNSKHTRWALYNLSNDRLETKDLTMQHPEILKELVTKWNQWANSHYVFPKRN